jgi:hypothetical protein
MPSSVRDNWVPVDLHFLTYPILFGMGQRRPLPGAGMLSKKDTMHANASNDRYWLRVLGDIRLRDHRDTRREYNPVNRFRSGKF